MLVEWAGDLRRVDEAPVELVLPVRRALVGTSGPRRIELRDGELHSRREGRPEYRILPLSDSWLALDGLPEFRLEVLRDGGLTGPES